MLLGFGYHAKEYRMNIPRLAKHCRFLPALIVLLVISVMCDMYGTGIVHLSKKFKNVLHELQEKNSQHPWSSDFCCLVEYLKGGSYMAQEKLVTSVIEEALRSLDLASQEASNKIKDFLTFKEEIVEGDIDNQDDSAIKSLQSDQDFNDDGLDHCYKIDIDTKLVDGPKGQDEHKIYRRHKQCCPIVLYKTGATGPRGVTGASGANGASGASGATGPAGSQGYGFLSTYGNFYTEVDTIGFNVEQDIAVTFTSDGPISTGGISRSGGISPTDFVLTETGVYNIYWQVPVLEDGQLALYINGTMLPQTLVGRETGNCPIIGDTLITTSVTDSVLTVRNPNSGPLTVAQSLYQVGTYACAILTIERIQ